MNKVILVGNLGVDPELKTLPSGQKVCGFSMATNETWTDAQGVSQKKTTWHNIQAWGKLSEICSQYLKKGSKVLIEGKISTRTWDDAKTGQKRSATDIVANSVQFLDNKQEQAQTNTQPQTQSQSQQCDIPF